MSSLLTAGHFSSAVTIDDTIPVSGMATATSSSFRKSGSTEAILVTAPRLAENDADSMAVVEPAKCQEVDISHRSNPIRRFLQSTLRGSKSVEDQELDDLDSPFQIKKSMQKRESVESYDICREYSCDSDDDLHSRYFNTPTNGVTALHMDTTQSTSYILGKMYHPINDYSARRDDESSLFWFTYRCDFPCIDPYGITSDAGWGCMLRALQMLMAQALRMHFKSREWRPQHSLVARRHDPFLQSVLTWFADFPSTDESVYSLHNMVAAGLTKYDKLPGEWYGPGTACYVLRDLVEIHEKRSPEMFRVHVASGGTVYRDSIEETMTTKNKVLLEEEKEKKAAKRPPPSHPLDVAWEDDIVDPLSGATLLAGHELKWDTALLLLIPLRLGLKKFNSEYIKSLAFVFSLPQSVGVLGGRPRGARWFYGAVSDGSKIFGLDPHTVQTAPKRRTGLVNSQISSSVEMSDDFVQSVHTTYPEVYSLSKLDPSIALGFYCRTRSDLESVFTSLRDWKASHSTALELFTVADKSPNYGGSNVIGAVIDSLLDDDEDDGTIGQGSENDDDYVML